MARKHFLLTLSRRTNTTDDTFPCFALGRSFRPHRFSRPGLFAASRRRPSGPSAQVLPSDVYIYFSIPSVKELKARWDKTQFSQIQKDPAFGDFVGELEKLFEKASQELEKETKLKLQELLDIPTGEVSVAVLKPPARPDRSGRFRGLRQE